MPAIHPNSMTLASIPIDIDASIQEISSGELITNADNTNTTDVIDASSEEILSISTAIPPSMSNDTASIAEIDVDLDIGNGMSITEAPTLYNVTDAIDGFRTGRNLDFFPNLLASITKNDPIAYIGQYKLSINTFADEMVNHLQRYGLSENLFEPLCKVGKAFEEFYGENSQKQALVKRYFQYISNLSNSSDSIPINCSDTTHWSIPTTTTPLSSIETTIPTEYVTSSVNMTLSPDSTTETLQPTNSTTLRPNLNTTQNSSHDKTVPTRSLNNLFSLGCASAVHGAIAGVVHTITGSIYNYYESKGRLTGWRKPAARAGVMLANATAIAMLPGILWVTEDESEQSSLTKIFQSGAYSAGGILFFYGVNSGIRQAYTYFNPAPMNKDSIVSKALDTLPYFSNTGSLINDGYNLTEATVILGTSILTTGLSSQMTQNIVNCIVNKTEKNKENDVETGSNNNIRLNNLNTNAVETHAFEQDDFNLDSQFQTLATKAFNTKNSTILDEFLIVLDKMKFFETKGDIKTQAFFLKNLILLSTQNPDISLHIYNHLQSQERLIPTNKNLEANCSIIPFTLNETVNLETHNDKESNADKNTIQLKKLLASFISGLKLNTKGFKFESKIFKAENKYSFERINIFYGTNQALSIFMPEIEQASTNHELLFSAINQLLENLSKNKSTANNSKFLFVLPIQSTTAVVEIVTYPSSSIRKISVYNPDNLLKNKLKALTNKAKKHGYVANYNPEINSSQANFQQHNPFSVYYFIKNSIKNYLETCLLPNNASPDFLEGLLATFIYKLKLTGLEFETEKVNPTENNQVSALAKKHIAPKNVNNTEEEIDFKNGYLVSTIDRKRNNAIAVCLSTKTLSIFKAIRPDNRANRTEIINCLLSKRTLEIQNDEIRRDLLPVADGKGMAIIEIITSESESKIIIHDLLGLLADIHTTIVAIAEKNGYQYAYNPNKDYSSDWQSKERCQLAAYYFIKKAALAHLALSDQMNSINKDINLPGDILDEVKHNLSINNEYDMDSLHEIKRCDGGVFNLKAYITDVSNYLKILSIKTAPLTNNSNLSQAITNEIQHNLGLTESLSNLSGSLPEVIIWNGVSFENWSELFSTKEVTLPETEIGNVYYLVKFPSDFMFAQGKMAVLSKQKNSEPEHALLSDLRNLLVYNSSDKDIKIVKKELWINALRELFSEFQAKESTHHETKVFTNQRCGFFSTPNSTTVQPVPQNHLTPGYK